MELSFFPCYQHHPSTLLHNPLISIPISRKRPSRTNSSVVLPSHCSLSSSNETEKPVTLSSQHEARRALIGSLLSAAAGIFVCDIAEAVSTSRRALRGAKIPESEYKTLPNGLKYYDLKVGGGPEAKKGSRVAVHYVAKWKNITFMTSRQGLGVGGGTPYGFDVGQSERGNVLKGLDLGVEGMHVGGQRLLIVPPELAYGSKGVQEIPPNATIELDVELLSIKQSPFGTPVKIVEG
ncbi:peptidyl-prolyl cis-trans isomerase FKBP16-4, chloroplastic isoform X1 [Pistacia vera]|uniref:peptidyl-prolyl cis-trans isomerase FKBP16-4, chloroplastic isoform X1 n=1 Tax=Pistacia vera TaxID=55513 RepID=UPI001262D267|nr:peptidyl-prolyl cis-trans isomerase FKBP16-4, chloroplastic isoform X1 [Pistacia vera]